MRFVFLLSGAFGFALVAVVGFSAQRQPDLVLRDAAIGCLLTAITGRWFWRTLGRAFAETLADRRRAAAARVAAEAAPPPAPTKPALPRSIPAPAVSSSLR